MHVGCTRLIVTDRKYPREVTLNIDSVPDGDGGDVRAHRSPELAEGDEKLDVPVPAVEPRKPHWTLVEVNVIEKLPAGGPDRPEMRNELTARVEVAKFRCDELADLDNRMNALFRNFKVIRVVENATILKKLNHPACNGHFGCGRGP